MATEPGGQDDRPPLFRTWRGMYTFVIVTLLVEIVVFSIVSRLYR